MEKQRRCVHSSRRRAVRLRRDVYVLYGFIAELGDSIFQECFALYDDEMMAARAASVYLVRALEERNLLRRIAAVP